MGKFTYLELYNDAICIIEMYSDYKFDNELELLYRVSFSDYSMIKKKVDRQYMRLQKNMVIFFYDIINCSNIFSAVMEIKMVVYN